MHINTDPFKPDMVWCQEVQDSSMMKCLLSRATSGASMPLLEYTKATSSGYRDQTHLFLPEQVRAGADSSALISFLQQLGTVARGLVHQHIPVLWGEDAALVQGAHNALQRCDLGFAVRDGFFV